MQLHSERQASGNVLLLSLVAPIPCLLLSLVLIFIILIIMAGVLQLWPLTLDRNDPGEDA